MDSTFSADHYKQYLMKINEELADPIVFRGMISDWKASRWQPGNLDAVFGSEPLTFRVGKKQSDGKYFFPLVKFLLLLMTKLSCLIMN
jgi:hypothetical protein